MFEDQGRDQLRQTYYQAWQKHKLGLPLDPLAAMICDVIVLHPEYHRYLDQADEGQDFSPAAGTSNPYLHMGMHIALREQTSTDRPFGIADVHRQLCRQTGDVHAAEHQMMECLGEALWQAQRQGALPDEKAYLACLQQQLK